MDSMRDKRYLFIALIVIGTSPLGSTFISTYLFSFIGFYSLPLIIFNYGIYGLAIYIHYYCFQRLGALGYNREDFFRFFVPIYGVFFAYQFGSKLLSSEIELPTSPKSGKGLSF